MSVTSFMEEQPYFQKQKRTKRATLFNFVNSFNVQFHRRQLDFPVCACIQSHVLWPPENSNLHLGENEREKERSHLSVLKVVFGLSDPGGSAPGWKVHHDWASCDMWEWSISLKVQGSLWSPGPAISPCCDVECQTHPFLGESLFIVSTVGSAT